MHFLWFINFQVLNKFPSLSRVDVFLYFVDVISVQIDRYKILDFNNNNTNFN